MPAYQSIAPYAVPILSNEWWINNVRNIYTPLSVTPPPLQPGHTDIPQDCYNAVSIKPVEPSNWHGLLSSA